MITKEEIKSDSRFYIDDWNLDRLTQRPVKRISIKRIKVGKINRYLDLKITSLKDTDVYRYLDNSRSSQDAYEHYCKKYCWDNNKRGKEFFNELIKDFNIKNYSLKKGAICIDAYNSIIEGQHRCCIILKKYGKDQLIDVVKFHYKGHEYKKIIKLIIYKIKTTVKFGRFD